MLGASIRNVNSEIAQKLVEPVKEIFMLLGKEAANTGDTHEITHEIDQIFMKDMLPAMKKMIEKDPDAKDILMPFLTSLTSFSHSLIPVMRKLKV